MYIVERVGNEGGDCIKQVRLACEGSRIKREGSEGGDRIMQVRLACEGSIKQFRVCAWTVMAGVR
jgi:hypothetical protein